MGKNDQKLGINFCRDFEQCLVPISLHRCLHSTAGKESIFFGNVHISSPQTQGIQWWTHIQSFRALELLQPSAGGNPIGVPIGAPKKNQWIYVHLHRDHADHSLRSCMPYQWLFYCQMMYLRLWVCTEPSTSVSCGRRFFYKGMHWYWWWWWS